MAAKGFGGDLGVTDAADRRGRAGEVVLDQLFGDAEGFEHLRAAVGEQRGNTHLGHDLEQAGVDGGLVIEAGLLGGDRFGRLAGGGQCGDQLERKVGVHCIGTEGEQGGDLVNVTGFAGFDHEVGLQAQAGADQLLIDRTDREQHRDGGVGGGCAAVGDDHDLGAGLADGGLGLSGEGLEGFFERVGALGNVE